jgi:hypothetical protein
MTIINNELESKWVKYVEVRYYSSNLTGVTEEKSRYLSFTIAGLPDENLIRNLANIIPHYRDVQLSEWQR